jgi:hypothetical protein
VNAGLADWLWLSLQARYFFQQLICGVSYCHFMVSKEWKKKINLFISKHRKKCPMRDFCRGFAANLPPRLEAGEHAAGRQPGASPQDLRLWLLQGAV